MNSFKRVHHSRSNWNLDWSVGFWEERGKPEYLSEQGREPTTNFDPRKASTLGFEPGPHFWEASALTYSHHTTLAPQEGGREKKESFQSNSTMVDLQMWHTTKVSKSRNVRIYIFLMYSPDVKFTITFLLLRRNTYRHFVPQQYAGCLSHEPTIVA